MSSSQAPPSLGSRLATAVVAFVIAVALLEPGFRVARWLAGHDRRQIELELPLADTEAGLETHPEVFTDYVHVTPEGDRLKAGDLARARARGPRTATPLTAPGAAAA